jgi:hypothetical protein
MIFSTKRIIVVVLALCAIALSSVKAQETRSLVARDLKKAKDSKKAKSSKSTKKTKSPKGPNGPEAAFTASTVATLSTETEGGIGEGVKEDVAHVMVQAIVDAVVAKTAAARTRRNRNLLTKNTDFGSVDCQIVSVACEIFGTVEVCALEVKKNYIWLESIRKKPVLLPIACLKQLTMAHLMILCLQLLHSFSLPRSELFWKQRM